MTDLICILLALLKCARCVTNIHEIGPMDIINAKEHCINLAVVYYKASQAFTVQ